MHGECGQPKGKKKKAENGGTFQVLTFCNLQKQHEHIASVMLLVTWILLLSSPENSLLTDDINI